jgi:hypothetical protein
MDKMKKGLPTAILHFSDPAGIRTQDPYIKSVMLYQLSYGILATHSMAPVFGRAKIL